MTEQPRTKPEPSVYEVIEIKHDTVQLMQVPFGEEAIREVAQWVASFGDTEVRDICADGFRYRTIGQNGHGRWNWTEPEDWLTRYPAEFDIPVPDYPLWGGRAWQHVGGPPLPPEYPDYDEGEGVSGDEETR